MGRVIIRRRLYKRGSSWETTIPKPILFAIDPEKKHNVIFEYDSRIGKWVIGLEERSSDRGASDSNNMEWANDDSQGASGPRNRGPRNNEWSGGDFVD